MVLTSLFAKPKKEITPSTEAIDSFIEHKAILKSYDQFEMFMNPNLNGLAELFTLPIENYYAKKGYSKGDLGQIKDSNYFRGIVSSFRDASHYLPSNKSLLIVNKKVQDNYVPQTFDHAIIISAQYDNENEIENYFDDWHFKEYSILECETEEIKKNLFDDEENANTTPWLHEGNWFIPQKNILVSDTITPREIEKNALEFIALTKILREHNKGVPFDYKYTPQKAQKQDLIKAISQSSKGKLNLANTSNYRLKNMDSTKNFHMSSDLVHKQAKHMYHMNTVLNSLNEITGKYRK